MSNLNSSKSIAIIYNSDASLYRFRVGLIRALRDRGVTVYAIAPPGRFVKSLEEAGAIFTPWYVEGRGINPISELRSLFTLHRILRRLRPTVTHFFTVKPNIYGAVAAKLAGISAIIASVTGLGYILVNPSWRAMMVRRWVMPLYHLCFTLSDAITFQNKSDWNALIGGRPRIEKKAHYMPGGSGVNLSYFDPTQTSLESLTRLRRELSIPGNATVAVFIGRALWEKGVAEYAASARIIRLKHPQVYFLFVGPTEHGVPGYVPLGKFDEWEKEGCLRYLGERDDVREILAIADLVVLPSYWEGTPRALLEAAAMSTPIVTSDAPGCREVVDHGTTGFLVPPKNIEALCESMENLILDSDLRDRFGQAAREKAQLEFDEKVVIAQFLRIYDQLLTTEPQNSTP